MKSKIVSFINTLMTLLILGIIFFLGIVIYNEFFQESIVDDVQQFVSNYTITGKDISENINQYNKEQEKIVLENSNENSGKINKYFYNQLNDYSKSIYNRLEENKENMKTGTYEINFGTEFSQLLSSDNGAELLGNYFQSAIESYTYDNPDIFYIDYGKLYLNIETTTRMFKKTYRVFINSGETSNYLSEDFSSKEKIDEAISEIEKVKAYFIQNKKIETYDNIKLVHDYLVDSIEYDQYETQENSHNIYGAIVNKQCVCEGYAKAFKYILDSLNIPCVIVIGEATDNENNTEILSIDNKTTFISVKLTDSIAYITEEGSKMFNSNSVLNIVNTSNNQKNIYNFDEVVKEMYARGNIIGVNVGTEIYFINTNGILIKKYTSNQEITNVQISSDLAIVIYKDRVEIINL